ncbi:hypothetical protein BCR39DRAFT_576487 [Naematelia encephala]|uniref:Uncharacterized protein n=1 Tax=Naematelia encephala TaxID=71784 RepID=A0A1Y2B192_9TREE|nr:hypothetical protein BCR39DRAFT_576487 [Naematelia encephala]
MSRKHAKEWTQHSLAFSSGNGNTWPSTKPVGTDITSAGSDITCNEQESSAASGQLTGSTPSSSTARPDSFSVQQGTIMSDSAHVSTPPRRVNLQGPSVSDMIKAGKGTLGGKRRRRSSLSRGGSKPTSGVSRPGTGSGLASTGGQGGRSYATPSSPSLNPPSTSSAHEAPGNNTSTSPSISSVLPPGSQRAGGPSTTIRRSGRSFRSALVPNPSS